jgi:ABC-type branched-subunit amino acid transport system ATPase component
MGTPFSLETQGLTKAFDGSQILCGVDLQLHPGERCALIGPNGAGKSSLFNLVSGRYRADAGRVLLHGQDITQCSPQQINRLGLARSFQITSLFPRLTAFENVRCALLWTLGYRYAFWRRLGRLHDASARAQAVLACNRGAAGSNGCVAKSSARVTHSGARRSRARCPSSAWASGSKASSSGNRSAGVREGRSSTAWMRRR